MKVAKALFLSGILLVVGGLGWAVGHVGLYLLDGRPVFAAPISGHFRSDPLDLDGAPGGRLQVDLSVVSQAGIPTGGGFAPFYQIPVIARWLRIDGSEIARQVRFLDAGQLHPSAPSPSALDRPITHRLSAVFDRVALPDGQPVRLDLEIRTDEAYGAAVASADARVFPQPALPATALSTGLMLALAGVLTVLLSILRLIPRPAPATVMPPEPRQRAPMPAAEPVGAFFVPGRLRRAGI